MHALDKTDSLDIRERGFLFNNDTFEYFFLDLQHRALASKTKLTKEQSAPRMNLLSTLQTYALSLVSRLNALLGVDSGIGASGKFECPGILRNPWRNI